MRVYVVENDDEVRATLRSLLEECGHEIEWYADGREFLHRSGSLPPGCIVVDRNLPGLATLDFDKECVRSCGDRHEVIVLSGPCDVCDAVAAMRAGAVDFFELPYRRAELLDALTRANMRLEERAAKKREAAKNLQLFGRLTDRELAVLRASSQGESSKVAAHKLCLSPRTIEMHRSSILKKLKVPTFAAALVMANSANMLHS
ncbi:response regulator transcription factor [Qipengyuania aquimaris]|uniref:response regulator transcription factor n=1 Tax=Qipengyuania aquimaris TaxID=255984 RepID=UPI001FD3A904|nr:response regulator [Qipengyuania aquimaris]UOR16694.1 response regulator [Qipengyuania aquimaris]